MALPDWQSLKQQKRLIAKLTTNDLAPPELQMGQKPPYCFPSACTGICSQVKMSSMGICRTCAIGLEEGKRLFTLDYGDPCLLVMLSECALR